MLRDVYEGFLRILKDCLGFWWIYRNSSGFIPFFVVFLLFGSLFLFNFFFGLEDTWRSFEGFLTLPSRILRDSFAPTPCPFDSWVIPFRIWVLCNLARRIARILEEPHWLAVISRHFVFCDPFEMWCRHLLSIVFFHWFRPQRTSSVDQSTHSAFTATAI